VERRTGYLAAASVLVLANAILASGAHIPWVVPPIGLAALLGIPVFLLYMAGIGQAPTRDERLADSVLLTVLLLMGAGLLANAVLPHLGVRAPLGRPAVLLTVDVLYVAVAAWAYRRHPRVYRLTLPRLTGRDSAVLCGALAAVALSAMGAIRLNNGAHDGVVTLCMLVLVAVVFWLLLVWGGRLHSGVIPAALYCLGLALLLMTSLRGWYTTGHDIQLEYRVFELTKTHAMWDVGEFRNAFNACLSITILPTVIAGWTHISDPYVYKVVFQCLFALCPVMVYRLATRVCSHAVALLATVYFVSFVAYFQDMPMLNRQEIAFLFLVAALLALFNDRLPVRRRRVWFVVFAVGMIVSHYTTTYLTIAVLLIAWSLRLIAPPVQRLLRRTSPRTDAVRGPRALLSPARRSSPATGTEGDPRTSRLSVVAWRPSWPGKVRRGSGRRQPAITLSVIAVVMVAAYLWSGPVTHTGDDLSDTVSTVLHDLRQGAGAKSSDTSYSLFTRHEESPGERLAQYRASSMRATAAGRTSGAYYPASTVSRYPISVVGEDRLPLTPIGKLARKAGVDVAAVNEAVRQASAKVLQLFVVLGLLSVLWRRRRSRQPPSEFYLLGVAMVVVLLLVVLVPFLSVKYGLLRVFQQSLPVLGVFVVAGSLALVVRTRRQRRIRVAAVVALAFFASSTGVLTTVVGGYEPQLHLSNSGTYYNVYYSHPEEVAAVDWLRRTITPGGHEDVQREVQSDRYTFTRVATLSELNTGNDIFPWLVRRNAYVFLGYTNVARRESTVFLDGDLVTYRYPLSFLTDNKDLIYSSGGARVYK
jgi:uncharacterized membrane protein